MINISLDYRGCNVGNKMKFYGSEAASCRTPVLSDNRSDNIDISCLTMYFPGLKYSVQR